MAASLRSIDSELSDIATIEGGKIPMLYDLSAIDELRSDEAKVPANTFLIVDTTGATYNRVVEDTRKGWKREVIGIIPVVTTAANALYVQNYINPGIDEVHNFESLAGSSLMTLQARDSNGNWLCADNTPEVLSTDGLLSGDLVRYIACDSHFHDISAV